MTLMRNLSLLKSVERQKLVQVEHERVLAALKRRDAPAASDAMRRHLENARNRMFGK
jgi:DNA-binding GntR family transcriptional regulator